MPSRSRARNSAVWRSSQMREREHAAQARHARRRPTPRRRARSPRCRDAVRKRWPRARQLGAQLVVVVDLAVEDDRRPSRPRWTSAGAPPARSMIAQARCAKADAGRQMHAFAVGTAVPLRAVHASSSSRSIGALPWGSKMPTNPHTGARSSSTAASAAPPGRITTCSKGAIATRAWPSVARATAASVS